MHLRNCFRLYSLLLCLIMIVTLVSIAQAADKLVDINRATVDELAEALPGIGPKKAVRIVQWREDHGPFPTIETLIEVHGIGERTLEKLRDLLTVGELSPSALLQSKEGKAMRAVQAVVSLAKREAERFNTARDDKQAR